MQISAAITSTRPWPSRSIRRPHHGAAIAPVSVAQALTIPAWPYEPVINEISSTMLSPVIDTGSRATNPAMLNASAVRSDSSVR